MPNPMETNKLLTLEEIEKIENAVKENLDQWQETTMRLDKVVGLLATARAYWEERKEKESMRSLNAALSHDKKGLLVALEEQDDKPHARTIQAVMEAMNLGVGTIWVDHCAKEVFMPEKVIKNLSSILKKYAKKQ